MSLDRFKDIFKWNFNRTEVVSAGGRFIDFSEYKFEKLDFPVRMFVEKIWSTSLLVYLEEITGQQKVSRLATPHEDKNLKIDYFNAEGQPVGHKVRIKKKRADAPCLRFQPCHGLDDPRTRDGRDYQCLVDRRTVYTQVAIYEGETISRIHRVDSEEFLELVNKVDEDWGREPLNSINNTWDHPNGSQVKWIKKERNFYKYMFYIPFHAFERTHTKIDLPESHRERLRIFHRQAWDYVVNRYIHFKET